MEVKQIVDKVSEIMSNKKAIDIEVIDIKGITIIADYFIICSGTSSTHVKGIADEIEFKLSDENNIHAKHIEGYESASWILMDYGDFIVHVFHENEREFYSLERLWKDGNFEHRK